MFDFEQQVSDLRAHINRVQYNANVLLDPLLGSGRKDFARLLMARAHVHDASKWHGIEWDYMHKGPDVNVEMLKRAVAQHQKTNDHHPEFWGGLRHMPEICVAEMTCDWLARSQEFGSDFWVFFRTQAPERFEFDTAPQQVKWIEEYAKLLLPKKFA